LREVNGKFGTARVNEIPVTTARCRSREVLSLKIFDEFQKENNARKEQYIICKRFVDLEIYTHIHARTHFCAFVTHK